MTKKICIFLIANLFLVFILYLIPRDGLKIDLCIYKLITGKECFNCGMTRAFLSVLHFDIKEAINYNKNVIVVFPLTVSLYLYTWYKYIFKKGDSRK